MGPLDSLSVLNHGLHLMVSGHGNQVGKWYDTILQEELVFVELLCCLHLDLHHFNLFLGLLLLPLFLKLGESLCISFLLLLLLGLLFLLTLFFQLGLHLFFLLLFILLLE